MSAKDIDWRQLGECRGLEPGIFYPDEEDEGLEAKAVVLLVPEVGKKPHRPRGSGMIVVDRQYLRPEITSSRRRPTSGCR